MRRMRRRQSSGGQGIFALVFGLVQRFIRSVDEQPHDVVAGQMLRPNPREPE